MTSELASRFRNLHEQDSALMLPNAWDVASAVLQQKSGAMAIGTSSAALCWSLGYPDGGKLPTTELLSAIRRICRCLAVPLTVDIEDGYSSMPKAVADLAAAVREAGAVGINIEDGAGPSEILSEKIAAIRGRMKPEELFVNARTDVYLRSLASDEEAASMVIARAKQYSAAGASGLFVPGLAKLHEVGHIASSTSLPLNLMALPGLQAIDELRAAGVRRLSVGPALFLSAYKRLVDDTGAFVQGNAAAMFTNSLPFGYTNELFSQQTGTAG